MDLRPAVMADAEAIRQIYNIEVIGSTATLDLVPRTAEEQAKWMVAHSGVYPVIVADDGGEVVGFASLSPYRPRPGYATAVEDSIYVAEQRRGTGIGRTLLSEAVVCPQPRISLRRRSRRRRPGGRGRAPSSLWLRPRRHRA